MELINPLEKRRFFSLLFGKTKEKVLAQSLSLSTLPLCSSPLSLDP
jgi:hypothetical protein